MAINPSIALGVRPMRIEQQDPAAGMNALARMMQLNNAMQEADTYRRGQEEENALRGLYRDPSFSWNNPEKRSAAFAASPTKASVHYKAFVDSEKDRFAMAEKGYNAFRQNVGSHINNPNATKQDVLASLEDQVAVGMMDPTIAQKLAATLPDDPTLLRGRIRQIVTAQMKPDEMLTIFAPKPTEVDNGQQKSFRDTNPNSPTYGQNTAGAPVQMQMTPGEQATDRRGRESNRISQERLDLERGTAVSDAGGPSQVPLVKRFGKPPAGYRWKPDGSMESVPGGPADIKAGEQGEKTRQRQQSAIAQADSVLSEIADAKGMVGWNTAGAGGTLAFLPGTKARDLSAKLQTIKANLGFDRLQQMRDQSPTGGALGQVAVQELASLQATVASLDQLQDATQLGKALDKIEKHYTKWKETVQQAASGSGGATGSWDERKPSGDGWSIREKK